MIEGLRVVCRQLQPEAAERGARLAAQSGGVRLLAQAERESACGRGGPGAVDDGERFHRASGRAECVPAGAVASVAGRDQGGANL